jgi:GAF domain-containing protein
MHNAPPAFADARASVVHPRQDTSLWRAGYRTVLSVPMLKENELIGVISIYRTEVRPFAIGETLSVALLIT